jgi:hypothetical protein
MMDLDQKTRTKYRKMAKIHADFLCEEVFKPAFEMAFLHGAEHMQEDIMCGVYIAKKVESTKKES